MAFFDDFSLDSLDDAPDLYNNSPMWGVEELVPLNDDCTAGCLVDDFSSFLGNPMKPTDELWLSKSLCSTGMPDFVAPPVSCRGPLEVPCIATMTVPALEGPVHTARAWTGDMFVASPGPSPPSDKALAKLRKAPRKVATKGRAQDGDEVTTADGDVFIALRGGGGWHAPSPVPEGPEDLARRAAWKARRAHASYKLAAKRADARARDKGHYPDRSEAAAVRTRVGGRFVKEARTNFVSVTDLHRKKN